MLAAKEQIRQIIADNNLNRAADVYSLLKDSFEVSFRYLWKQTWMLLPVMKKLEGRYPDI